MVPQNSQHSSPSMQLGQQIRARLDEYEIACQHHQVRIQSIDNVDRFANRDYRKMFVVMKIAHLRDPDSVPGFGQSRERNFDLHELWMIRLKNRTLGRYGQSASRKCGFKEVPSIKEL